MNLQMCTKNKTTIGNNNVILKIIIVTPPQVYSKYIVLTQHIVIIHISVINHRKKHYKLQPQNSESHIYKVLLSTPGIIRLHDLAYLIYLNIPHSTFFSGVPT